MLQGRRISDTYIYSVPIRARQVWNKIALDYHFTSAWNGISISDCFSHWTSSERIYKFLPPLVIWFIWLARNKLIFDNISPSINSVAYKSLGLHQIWKEIHPSKGKTKIFINPSIVENISTGWFDGAAQHNGALSGAGGLIRITENSLYKWTFSCGPGTNTRAELLGAWATLHLATRLNIDHLQLIEQLKSYHRLVESQWQASIDHPLGLDGPNQNTPTPLQEAHLLSYFS
jgi:hypothetical protein